MEFSVFPVFAYELTLIKLKEITFYFETDQAEIRPL